MPRDRSNLAALLRPHSPTIEARGAEKSEHRAASSGRRSAFFDVTAKRKVREPMLPPRAPGVDEESGRAGERRLRLAEGRARGGEQGVARLARLLGELQVRLRRRL